MNTPNVSVITWNRKRRNAAGKIIRSKRFAARYICPETGNKRRISFPTKSKAEEYRQVLLAQFVSKRYFNPNVSPTVAEVVDHWLENKLGTVKAQTIRGYLPLIRNVVGPILQGTPQRNYATGTASFRPISARTLRTVPCRC